MGTSFEGPPRTGRYLPPAIPAQRQAPPGDPAPSPGPPRRWPWLVGGLAAGMLAGGGAGAAAALSSTTAVAAPPVERTVTVTAPAPPADTVTVTVPAPPPQATAVEPAGPRTTFGAGIWEVGVDIAAGKYKTTGTDSYGCYYARLRQNDGSLGDIIGNGFVQGPVTVLIREDDGYFETSGCDDWVRAG